MKVSITKATALANVSRTTLYNDKKSGKLTIEKDGKGKPVIDVSELERVYGSLNLEEPATVSNDVKSEHKNFTSQDNKGSLSELAVLRKQVEMLEAYQARERQQFEDQIENLQDSLKLSQEGHNKATLLLENKEGGAGAWGKSMKAMEARIANQEKSEKERQEREQKILRQNQSLKKALQNEREKSFFQKLFG